MSNAYYLRLGRLDKQYLRVCAVYRLLRKRRINKSHALQLLAQRHNEREMKVLRATVELWQAYPLKKIMRTDEKISQGQLF
jgi:hypothetical protein